MQLLGALPANFADKQIWSMKPRDKTVANWTQQLGFKETANWPPRKPWFSNQEPPGYTVWPRHTFDTDADNAHLESVFRRAMMHGYKSGNTILFMDEIFGVAELGLQNELSSILSRGAGMGCAAWMSVQRGSGTQQVALPGYIFSQPYHNFIAHSSNKSDRQRYADMNGDFDPDFIAHTVLGLRQYEFLYTNADGHAAVISA
jgi:hypothetical protein